MGNYNCFTKHCLIARGWYRRHWLPLGRLSDLVAYQYIVRLVEVHHVGDETSLFIHEPLEGGCAGFLNVYFLNVVVIDQNKI